MITLICDDIVEKDKMEEVKSYYRDLVEYTRKQPGCISYDVYQDAERENALVFVEKWSDQRYLDDHLNDPVYIEMFGKIEKHLVEDETLRKFREFV